MLAIWTTAQHRTSLRTRSTRAQRPRGRRDHGRHKRGASVRQASPHPRPGSPEKITVTFYDQWGIEADEQEKVAGPGETV
jgi:hypothetical protein